MSRRRQPGPPPTVLQLLVLLFVIGVLFKFWPVALLLGALLLVNWAEQKWQLRPRKPRPRPVTVQVPRLVIGTEVVSTHPASVIKPQLLGKIVAPTQEERVALGFEYGTDLVMVDWYGCARRWTNLQHLQQAAPAPRTPTTDEVIRAAQDPFTPRPGEDATAYYARKLREHKRREARLYRRRT